MHRNMKLLNVFLFVMWSETKNIDVVNKTKPSHAWLITMYQVWIVLIVRRRPGSGWRNSTQDPGVEQRDREFGDLQSGWSAQESWVQAGADGKYPRQGYPKVYFPNLYFSDLHFSYLAQYFHLYFIQRFPHHLLTCYKLAKLVDCSKQMTKFREKVLKLTLTLGYNYHRYYADLMDWNPDIFLLKWTTKCILRWICLIS